MAMKVNQNLLLSRILTYMNGTLFNDFYYKIGAFIIDHYLEIENMSEETFLQEGPFQKTDLEAFMGAFGYDNYEEFKLRLYSDYQTRLNQIRVRLFDVKPQEFLKKMDMTIEEKELQDLVSEICKKFFASKRIIVMGALYPLSLSVELQTDMITFGKPFIQYHSYNPMTFTKDDVVIVISGTGRAFNSMKKSMADAHIENAYSVLLTQNKKYRDLADAHTKVLVLPGKFDSVEFNYQLMAIFDLVRLQYFQQYYLTED
ncbi:MurR/RpiR family transcriptional regulator [Intestinibaculum porci]|jgi:DNA-binding MurR/RpiR family transcriptional regulator|uniref:SIS domain-containing protein n=1 Tax=Intestinibaculum porci TaxID=2487118 RepID=A0A3G9JN87_9FIRM|nr:MurR/RpiR family transcriptional regulator [Intestinibaculum porci]MDD6350627.1 MurR/RpiR family transcriptional regulator [Intestinibaculum porci]BBH26463.1 hypothetical protein SG0102_13970 [Intestinibaculum porci]HAN58687.1 hypothetical protein [Erysipelotrichaceae bacterium]